jgi:hypothetical protein
MKSMVSLILAFIFLWLYLYFFEHIEYTYRVIFFFPIIMILVYYAFIKLTLWYVKYYNNLLIIYDNKIIVIKTSLYLKDDVEFIDIRNITKIDTFCRWFFSNLFRYWTLVVEQQRDQVREFHFIPKPHRIIQLINEAKRAIINKTK